MINRGLRFAPLLRVSTEKQEQQGESLKTQRTDLEADIKAMGGEIYKWYAGQEHSTPDYERKILDQLIRDTQQNKFDAVIVWSIDRWSRDNLVSEQGLKILRDNHVKFFVRTKEYDLFNTSDYFFVALYVLMGRTQAVEQSRKSILNKIHRAKQGHPTCGQLPFGRTYDKEHGWAIDQEKQRIIIDAARRYLEGESMVLIAKSYNMNHPNLNKLLKHRSGDTWEQRFVSKRCNIDETVTIKIPRLLPEETITKIHQRSEANKTYAHGQTKNQYLLARMILCGECSHAIFGDTNHNRKRYYRHPRNVCCKSFTSIPADIIEEAVIEDIFQMLGDLPRIEQAAKDALPNIKEHDDLIREIKQAENELLKIRNKKDRLLDLAENGTLHDTDLNLKERMEKHREREALLRSTIDARKSKLKSIPSEKDIKRRADFLLRLRQEFLKMKKHLDEEMTFDDKRRLLQYVFDGKDADGKRCGVYIRKADNDRWIYEINGLFHEKGIAKNINHLGIAPKIYYNADEFVFEPLEDSWPVIETSEKADALTAEARVNCIHRTQEQNEQDMHCIHTAYDRCRNNQ